MRHLESLEAQALIHWWSLEANRRKLDQRLLIHIANEGRVGGPGQIRAGYRKKLEGLVKGTPDYILCIARSPYYGLWLELKSMKGRLEKEQEEMIGLLNSYGYKAVVCFGWGQASDAIKDYMGWQ